MSRFASFQQISGMSASWPAILVGIGSRRATTSGWRHRRLLRGTDGSRKPRISRRTPPRFALNRRTMRACLLADFLGPGQKLRPTTGELPCRVSRRIAAWMAQMVVSIEVARLLLSPPQYPPMHHAQAERRTAHGTARMGPCRHAFPRQSLLHSITSSPLELSWSTKSRPALPSFHQRLQAAFPGPSLSPRRGLKPGT